MGVLKAMLMYTRQRTTEESYVLLFQEHHGGGESSILDDWGKLQRSRNPPADVQVYKVDDGASGTQNAEAGANDEALI